MSTRGIVAITDGDDFVGVYHQYESHPWHLGNEMLLELAQRQGDLRALLEAWIRSAPYGWAVLSQRRKNEDYDPSDPPFWRKKDLAGPGWIVGWIEWFYLFDEAARTLRVWDGNPAYRDRWDAPLAVVRIGVDGRCQPPVFAEPRPDLSAVPSFAGWEGDDAERRASRTRFKHWMARRPQDAERVRKHLEERVASLKWHLQTVPPSERELRVLLGEPPEEPTAPDDGVWRFSFHRDFAPKAGYWSVTIGSSRLALPSQDRGIPRLNELRRGDGAWARWELDLPDDLERALLLAAAEAEGPGDYAFDDEGTLYQFKTVVADGDLRDPSLEVPLSEAQSEDDECRAGDALGFSVPESDLTRVVLEWLRISQIAGGIEDDT